MTTKDNSNTPKYLGAAFLFQAIASILWTILLTQLVVSEDIIASMVNISEHALQMQASIVITGMTSIGIVVLGSLLYVTLKKQNEILARIAFGLYLLEVAILAVSRIPAFALLRVSQESVAAGHPAYLQDLGELLYQAADFGDWLHMLPFAIGAALFYSLFFKSGYIPRALALFGLAAATLAIIGTSLVLLGVNAPTIIVALNFPFEVGVGLWLMIKGFNKPAAK